MGIYGLTAVAAYGHVIHKNMSPNEAWACRIRDFTKSIACQKKSCPKQTFLAAMDLLQNYETEGDNHNLVREALKMIQKDESIANNESKLWGILFSCGKANNRQLDVIICLWRIGCFDGMGVNDSR